MTMDAMPSALLPVEELLEKARGQSREKAKEGSKILDNDGKGAWILAGMDGAPGSGHPFGLL